MRLDGFRTFQVGFAPPEPMVTAAYRVESVENVLLECYADGLTGIGYGFTFTKQSAQAMRALVEEFASLAYGLETIDVKRAREACAWQASFLGEGGLATMALACLDTALWDLKAQSMAVPVWALLGAAHQEVPVYATGGSLTTPNQRVVDTAVCAMEAGYRGFKMKVGGHDWRQDVMRVAAVRSAVGDQLPLMVDANQAWSRKDALRVGNALEEFDLAWIEEPVDAYDFQGSAEIGRRLRTPLAAGESLFGLRQHAELIRAGGVDVIMPNLMRVGGPTAFMQIADWAGQNHKAVSSHTFAEVSCQLVAASGTGIFVEHLPGWWDQLFDEVPPIRSGCIVLGDQSGFGLRFSQRVKELSDG